MNRAGLALRSLRFYWRTNLGVAAGAAIGAAVLVGALLVGDSVRLSLREQSLLRVGRVDVALVAGDRFVRAALAGDVAAQLDGARLAPVLRLDGIAATPDAARRANDVSVLGVDRRFFALASAPDAAAPPAPDGVLLNGRLARQLDAAPGATVVLRLERPSAMPRDMVLAENESLSIALRLTVAGIVPDDAFGRFGLEANQVPPYNAFVDLARLQDELDLAGRVNLLLAAGANAGAADAALRATWTLDDAELERRPRPGTGVVDLLSRRVFIDEPVERAAAAAAPDATGVLTYFVNELRAGERATPYSMVTAVGSLGAASGASVPSGAPGASDLLPPDLADDEIVVNRWLADDLGVAPGDAVTVTYFVPGASRRLVEDASTFRVRSIVALAGAAADPTLMPDFPGLADAESCRDWETGIPIELDRIRDVDETYWDEHRGTPKAFVTLAAGRRMWSNRFGGLTAVRLDAGAADETLAALRAALDPAAVGLFFQDVRGPALAAGTTATDFGGLFLGLSLFLIVSALLLIAMLFGFGVEQRSPEIGTLLAVGFRPADVRRLLLREAVLIAALGSLAGAVLGVGYTRLVLLGLATVWQDAVGATTIGFHAQPASIAIGTGAAGAAALVTIWFALRRAARRPAVALLAARGAEPEPGTRRGSATGDAPARTAAPGARRPVNTIVAAVCLVGALVIVVATGADRGPAAAGAFFGAGALLLAATVAVSRALLARLARVRAHPTSSVGGLGVRNAVRRPGRSLAVVTLIACGTFLVMAVGANRLDAGANAASRAAGTGGFALYARSTIPVPQDLGTPAGRAAFGLGELADVRFVPMRLRAGDDASCLNLSLSRQPRLLGVDPALLDERGAFTFAKTLDDTGDHPWTVLGRDLAAEDGVPIVPAIGDQASLTWAMHKRVGDSIDYRDERGRPFRVRVVGAVANSILQGNLLIDERRFVDLFPSESGSRLFLIDAPPERAGETALALGRALSDVGLEVTSAAARLAEFNAVQNTYLAIFQVLGGLGLLLGSAGLGMLVLRNVLERRSELAVLRAVGFRARALRWLVASEHGLLLALGLAGGTAAALVAVIPALRSPGAEAPIASTLAVGAAVAASGLLWVWLATAWGLRGEILDALRDE